MSDAEDYQSEEEMQVEAEVVEKRGRGRPKGPPKPPKEKGGRPKSYNITKEKKAKPTHAPFTQLVTSAIQVLHEKKGVSKVAIVKHIMESEPECTEKDKVKRSVGVALKRLLLQGTLTMPKGHVGKIKFAVKEDEGRPKKAKGEGKGRGRPRKAEGESPKKKIAKSPKKKISSKLFGKAKEGDGFRVKKAAKKASAYVPSGKPRGRPKLTDATPKKAKSAYVKTGLPRGRPKSTDAAPKKAKSAYVPTGLPRGRPKEPGTIPKPAYVPTGKPRGRPKKTE